MDYRQAISYLESFIDYERRKDNRHKSHFRLDRMRKLLKELKNPQDDFKSVHIAGTNGKGSTAAMLASVLSEAGYKTGLYTSPHLVTFRERIRVNGGMITEEETAEFTSRLRHAVSGVFTGEESPSFFEVYTALCFLYFSEKSVDFAVIETGLGGRLDATNVLKPLLCILTPIGMDHMRELGDTPEKIALEKCGIMKPGAPVITSRQEEGVLKVIRETALKTGSPLTEVRFSENSEGMKPSRDFFLVETARPEPGRNVFHLHAGSTTYEKLQTSLPGPGQALNAGSAAAAALKLGIAERHIREGLRKANLPGRLQFIPGTPPLLLDGGHNPPAARNLAGCLDTIYKEYSITLVFGVSRDKDYRAIADIIFPRAERIILTKSLNPRALEPEVLAGNLPHHDAEIQTGPGIREALSLAFNQAGSNTLVCVTGSFFLVGEALELMEREPGLFRREQAAATAA